MTEKIGGKKAPLMVNNVSGGFTVNFQGGTQSITSGGSDKLVTAWAGPLSADLLKGTSRYTVVYPGIYFVNSAISWPSDGTGVGTRLIEIYKNGSSFAGVRETNGGATDPVVTQITRVDVYSTGDIIDIRVNQDSGATLAISSAWFTVMPMSEKPPECFLST